MRVFSTPHIAELFHQPHLTEVCKSDWVRVGRFLRGEWPKPLPRITEWNHRTRVWEMLKDCPYLAIDTEYDRETKKLVTLGIGGPDTPVVQWWSFRQYRSDPEAVVDTLRSLVHVVPVYFQNAMADLPVLDKNLGLHYTDFRTIEDTMFMHAVLWTEMPHDLEFLASIVGEYEKMKHLPIIDPLYNAGDVAETLIIGQKLQREMSRDKKSEWVYRECMLPLIPILLESQSVGIGVDRPTVKHAESEFMASLQVASRLAEAYAGFPINLGSQGENGQVARFLTYDLPFWQLHGKRLKVVKSIDDDTIAELRGAVLPFDPQEEISLDNTCARIRDGGHPILECRVLYARCQQYLSHYIEPMLAGTDNRVYPEFHPWTQHTGRWSTVNPPLAQLPSSLRKALIPDPGYLWFEYDWSAIELRLIAALARDPVLLEGFEKEWDLHTVHMCEAFNLPKPKGWTKKDIAEDTEWLSAIGGDAYFEEMRRFTKVMVFRLCYGGTPESAPSIPGAKALGLSGAVLIAASKRWIAQHRTIRLFWKTIEREALSKRQLRTFLGRRWNFMGHDRKRILRQMYDFPMQGGVADIKNLVIVQTKKALGNRIRFAYEMHDSVKWQLKITPHLEEDKQTIRNIAEQMWNINGLAINFPAEYKERVCEPGSGT